MSAGYLPYPTFAETVVRQPSILKNTALVFAGSLLLVISAKVHIPFYPVPMTMQTFVVLVLGMALGWRLGTAAVLLYLLEGTLGLPVFSGTPERGIGLAYMTGPTGGYLAGFVVAAALCGYLAGRGWDRSVGSTFLAMVLGNLVIYGMGLWWLGSLIGWDKPVLELGLKPFIVGDLFKIILAVLVVPAAWKLVGRAGERSSGD